MRIKTHPPSRYRFFAKPLLTGKGLKSLVIYWGLAITLASTVGLLAGWMQDTKNPSPTTTQDQQVSQAQSEHDPPQRGDDRRG